MTAGWSSSPRPATALIPCASAVRRRLVRISFAKVAEYQRRGAVHVHAVIRVDAATGCGRPACVAPPPAGFTADLLERAVRQAAAAVVVPCPAVEDDQAVILIARWGEQLDVRQITEAGDDRELSAERVAGYVAKYATKATEALGVTLDRQAPAAHQGRLPDQAGVPGGIERSDCCRAGWDVCGAVQADGAELPGR